MSKFLLVFITIIFLASNIIYSQTEAETEENLGLINWISLEKAEELNKTQPRPILLDFYTDWCGWCKHMNKTTYSNPNLAAYINERFYAVRFDGETKDTVSWQGKQYVNNGTGKRPPHDFAKEFMEGKMSYPTTVFMSADYKIKYRVPGYLDSKKIEPFLVYFVEHIFGSTTYNDFSKSWDRAFIDSTNTDTIHWHNITEAINLNKVTKKKMIIYVSTDWCNSCKVMKKADFTDTIISKYINENYYLVDFNPESNDTFTLNNKTYTKTAKDHFHPFITDVQGSRIMLPSLIFVDEKGAILSSVPFYRTAYALEPVLHFFGNDNYKTTQWEPFYKDFKYSIVK